MKIRTILQWIFILFLAYIFIELIRRIFSGSLGFEELVIGLLIANLGFTFHIDSKLSEHMGWHKGKTNSN